MAEENRFEQAIKLMDERNKLDPNKCLYEGTEQPHEWVYSIWLSDWVVRLDPEASEALRLAARAQHICRWEMPRKSCPMDRPGYLKWREDLKKHHAKIASDILETVGYDETIIKRVESLNRKRNIKTDPECQTLEDALCLVFLEHQFDAFLEKTDDEAKIIRILQKSWGKMSKQGQAAALKLKYSVEGKLLVEKALS